MKKTTCMQFAWLVAVPLVANPGAGVAFEIGGTVTADATQSSDGTGQTRIDTTVDTGKTPKEEDDTSENFYRMDMKPGMSVSREREQSTLAEAARNRSSIRIGVKQKLDARRSPSPNRSYTVREGDTLWGICETHFGDPYVWPRIWSYNPTVTNPNWLYPGDTLWLAPPSSIDSPRDDSDAKTKRPQHASTAPSLDNAILSRNRGFVDTRGLEQAGILRGSQNERMLLSQYDEAYVEFKKNRNIKVGDEFAAYRVLRHVSLEVSKDNQKEREEGTARRDTPEDISSEETEQDGDLGKVVEIMGTVRVISFDPKQRVARVIIDESLHPIERGTMIGPVHSRFELVPPRTNEREMSAHVIGILNNTLLFSQHEIVFINKGRQDGVQTGNRFFSVEKRDNYRKSRKEKDDHDGYPYEVVAELRVIETRAETATCLVTGATRALETGAYLEMVKGY